MPARDASAGEQPAPEGVDHLVQEHAQVPATLLEPVEQVDAGRRVAARERIDEPVHELALREAEQLAHAPRARCGRAVEARSWSRIDSASRIPPAARRATMATASGSACRPSAARIRSSLPLISSTVSRRTSNRWRRDRIAGGKSCGWVEANMNVTNSGGSSSDLRSAFQASRVIWWASSRM